jgi:acyl-coenzyme A thioesterase PaaI-like protein
LTAVGTVTKPGSRVAFAEAVITDSEGRIVATASSTLLVFPHPHPHPHPSPAPG